MIYPKAFPLCFSYRRDYDWIRKLPNPFPSIPLMALTATATPDAVADLKQLVCDAVCEVASVNKSNIAFLCVEIQPKHE